MDNKEKSQEENVPEYIEVFEKLRAAMPAKTSMLTVLRASELLLADTINQGRESGLSEKIIEETIKSIPDDVRNFAKAFDKNTK